MKMWKMMIPLMMVVASCLTGLSTVRAWTITITDQTVDLASYLDGFDIGEDQKIVWQCTKPVTGTIRFADETSVLQLDKSLIFSGDGKISMHRDNSAGCTIDGKGNHIELGANATWPGMILLLKSALTIVGAKGVLPLLQVSDFKVIGVNPKASLTLQDLRFNFSHQVNETGVCYIPLTLNNVQAEGIGDRRVLMAGRNALVIQNLVSVTSTASPKKDQYLIADDHLDIFITAKGTLKVMNCTLKLVQPEQSGSCSISMLDKASTLYLSACDFDIGDNNLMLEAGSVQYEGVVNISGKEFGLGAALTEVGRTDAVVLVGPIITRQVINDTNAKNYLKGFTVPAKTTYEWSASAKSVVAGPISFTGNASKLDLKTNLEVATLPTVAAENIITDGIHGICLTINSKNSKTYAAGFEIKSGTTAVWADGKNKLVGVITRADDTAKFRLAADLHIEGAGLVSMPFDADGRVLYHYSRPLVVGINDTNYAKYKDGFVIPAGVTYEWAAQGPLTGPVTFTSASSTLKLGRDIHMGVGGRFVATDEGGVQIDNNGKKILLDVDYTFDGKYIYETQDQLFIDGQGHTLTFKYAGDNSSEPGMLRAVTVSLANVNLSMRNTNNTLCGPDCLLLDITGKVALADPGQVCTLIDYKGFAETVLIVINANSMLYIGPDNAVNACLLQEEVQGNIFCWDGGVLYLDGCDFYTGNSTSNLLFFNIDGGSGALMIDHMVNVHSCARDESPTGDTAFALGINVLLKYLNGATLTVKGAMIEGVPVFS